MTDPYDMIAGIGGGLEIVSSQLHKSASVPISKKYSVNSIFFFLKSLRLNQ